MGGSIREPPILEDQLGKAGLAAGADPYRDWRRSRRRHREKEHQCGEGSADQKKYFGDFNLGCKARNSRKRRKEREN